VCTPTGTIFDIKHIIPWLKKHGTNPITGDKLDGRTLITLRFDKNEHGEYVDPVTKKVFTDFSKLVAIKTSGRVYLWETVDQLNLKAKNMNDLVSEEEFTRSDLIILQDPMDLDKQNISNFKNLQEDQTKDEAENEPTAEGILRFNSRSLIADKISKAKEAVARIRAKDKDKAVGASLDKPHVAPTSSTPSAKKALPYNAAVYNTGKAAASFTSTALDVVTTAERALISEEDYMLVVKRIKIKGYASIQTNFGNINVELYTDYAPKAVYNFVKLSQQGYYNNTIFHRNVRNFMVLIVYCFV
jgi:peptidyl-prolyl cis-trans isomerase-like 2